MHVYIIIHVCIYLHVHVYKYMSISKQRACFSKHCTMESRITRYEDVYMYTYDMESCYMIRR